jgi:hypothetical protein
LASSAELEARLLGRYLLGKDPNERAIALYRSAIIVEVSAQAKERSWRMAMRRPWLIGPLDAGLALLQPTALLRERIWVMSAILEACPEYYEDFAPQHGVRALVSACWAGVRAAANGALGLSLAWFLL